MNGKRAKALRRLARALHDGWPPHAYRVRRSYRDAKRDAAATRPTLADIELGTAMLTGGRP